MTKFSLKFDSDIEDIGFSNAISIDELGEILKSLYQVISAKKNDKITLSNVVDNCYQVDFATPNDVLHNRFLEVGKNILEKSDIELNPKELRFKKTISSTLRVGMYLDILNSDGVSVVTLPYGFSERAVDYYYSRKNIEGLITEIGDKDLHAKGLHIYISDNDDYKIFVTTEQHDELSFYYRKIKIRAKVELKKSLVTDKTLSAKLITFKPKDLLNFPNNLQDIDLSDINFIHE